MALTISTTTIAQDITAQDITAQDITPAATNTYGLGTSSTQWDTVYSEELYSNGIRVPRHYYSTSAPSSNSGYTEGDV